MRRAVLGVALVVAGAGCGPWPPIVLDPLGFRGSEPSGSSVSPPAHDSGEVGLVSELPTSPGTIPEEVGPPPATASTPRGPSSEGVGPPAPAGPVPALSDATLSTLACIRRYEGAYTTNTGNGYFGAYQFLPSTWAGAVARAGYPEWSEMPASEAPPAVQDAAAAQLLSEQGLAPWPLPAERCS